MVHAGGVPAQVGEGVGRPEVQQRRQVPRLQLHVEQEGFLVAAGQDGGQVHGEGARTAAAAGGQEGEGPGRLGPGAQLGAEPHEGRLEFAFEFRLVQVIAGPGAHRLQHQPRIPGRPDDHHAALPRRADPGQRGQAPGRLGRQDDHHQFRVRLCEVVGRQVQGGDVGGRAIVPLAEQGLPDLDAGRLVIADDEGPHRCVLFPACQTQRPGVSPATG
jgi:hypothetical protein